MDLSMAVIILASGLVHMYAALLLFSGRRTRQGGGAPADTPDKDIFAAGILSLLAGGFWMMPLYYLSKLPTFAGMAAFISFALFVLSAAVFHVAASFARYAGKQGRACEDTVRGVMKIYGLVYLFWAAAYSLAMVWLGVSGILKMSVVHYLTLPLPAILAIQLGLGVKLKKTAYCADMAGTLALVVSLLSTVNIMVSNQIQ